MEPQQCQTSRCLDDFVHAHGQALLRFAFLLTGGRAAEAEDLVQTVLLRLTARGIDDLDDPTTYARRAILNERRSVGRRASSYLRLVPRLAPADTHYTTPAIDDRMAIFEALRVLSVRERAVVVLRYYEDLSDIEIADVLGCSRATVRSLAHRATPKLQGALAPTYPPRGDSVDTREHHDD